MTELTKIEAEIEAAALEPAAAFIERGRKGGITIEIVSISGKEKFTMDFTRINGEPVHIGPTARNAAEAFVAGLIRGLCDRG